MILTRFAQLEDVTIGRLNYAGQYFFTVERPWKDNEPNISCIPTGNYQMGRVDSPKFGPDTWEIRDVPGRTHILIHVANTADDVLGCIGLGRTVYPTLGGVGSSRVSVDKFHDLTAGSTEEEIIIINGALM